LTISNDNKFKNGQLGNLLGINTPKMTRFNTARPGTSSSHSPHHKVV